MKGYQLSVLTGEEEARLVHSAIILGDHETLSIILATLGQAQRLRLLRHYRAIFGKKLSRVLEDNLAGDYLHICLSIIDEPFSYVAKGINDLLLEFPAPRLELCISVLCERSTEEITSITENYEKRFKKSLLEDMSTKLLREDVKWIKYLIIWKESDSCCDLQQISKDAQKLLMLGLGRAYGGEGPVLASLLATRCSSHLRLVFGELRRLGRPPNLLLETALPVDTRNTMLAIIRSIESPEKYNAQALWLTKAEPGRLWKTLLSIRLSRNKEFYKKVDLQYNQIYSRRLSEDLKNDTGENVALLMKKLLKF